MNKLLLITLVLSLLSGCAVHHQEHSDNVQTSKNDFSDKDPFESANRTLWDFNWNVLDKYILKPTTTAYTTVLPGFARSGLRNAARNLEEPGNTVNNFFQGKGKLGFRSLSRFAINSTLGLLGLIDVANELGLPRADEDFDETLAIWGVESGPFVMVPVLGPNDTRGVVGDISDNIFFPMTLLDTPLNLGRILINTLESRAVLMDQEQQIRQAVDEYAFVKSAYFQNKLFLINGEIMTDPEPDQEELEEFDEFEMFLEEDGGQADTLAERNGD